MKFSVGDRVKFVDQIGGGVVSKIIDSKTVNVLTEDDFEIPFACSDLIKIDSPKSVSERIFMESLQPLPTHPEDSSDESPEDSTEDEEFERVSALHRGYVSKDSQKQGVYLAFVPHDQQWLLKGSIDLYIINYTPYTLVYNMATLGSHCFYGVDYGVLPAHSKIWIESIEREDIGLWSEGILQCSFFADDAEEWLAPVSERYQLKTRKFIQEDSYIYPVFMREKSLLIPIVDIYQHRLHPAFTLSGNSEKDETGTASHKVKTPEIQGKTYLLTPYLTGAETAEVDLHADKLLTDFKNLQPHEILQKQLDFFERFMNEAISAHLSKIVFIHGVGNGSLKAEIIKRLKDYDGLHYFDAAIHKYGKGAIEIWISK